jgi:GNAT superfamily N-acetyltransferase
MWWRLARGEFNQNKGAKNRAAMKRLVTTGPPPGILAFHGDVPVGWCAVGPRIDYPALQRSRVLKPIDEEPVWSVTCFFVAKPYRRQGVTVQLLQATIDFVHNNGGRIIEGYPIEPKTDEVPDAFVWTGLVSAFRRAGFVEVARRSATRPIMRFVVANDRGG